MLRMPKVPERSYIPAFWNRIRTSFWPSILVVGYLIHY